MKKVLSLIALTLISVVSFSQWEIQTYKDSFGDDTDAKYIQNFMPNCGVFSNSATNGSELTVGVAVERNKDVSIVNIRLFEYNRGPEVGLQSGEVGKLLVKLPDGTTEAYGLMGTKTLHVSKKKDNIALIDYLLNGTELKCYIVISNVHYSMESKYVFTLPADNFKEVYTQLIN